MTKTISEHQAEGTLLKPLPELRRMWGNNDKAGEACINSESASGDALMYEGTAAIGIGVRGKHIAPGDKFTVGRADYQVLLIEGKIVEGFVDEAKTQWRKEVDEEAAEQEALATQERARNEAMVTKNFGAEMGGKLAAMEAKLEALANENASLRERLGEADKAAGGKAGDKAAGGKAK